ncbi:MAG: hypothetical protein KKF62_19665 [Bacteroidetes bacterium]|nr:hypothetical protein [Bacteroidota bacterium]
MPEPFKGETKKDYIQRAIKYIMNKENVKSYGHAWHKAQGLWKKYKENI